MKTQSSTSQLLGSVVGFLGAIALFVFIMLVLSAVPAYFEAKAYNHATGSNVSTWDAMFLELRIQAEPKSND